MTAIFVNYAERKIILSSAFVKKALIPGTAEYTRLQSVRDDFPDFVLETRKFKANTSQEHYRGLTYDFMEKYIASHDNAEARMAEFNDLRATSDEAVAFGAEALSYGEIKAWFFKNYPEIEAFQKRREGALAA